VDFKVLPCRFFPVFIVEAADKTLLAGIGSIAIGFSILLKA
jgi:hypothetical protein